MGNKFLGFKILRKASLKKLRSSRKPREHGEAKTKKKDKKWKTKLIAKVRQDLPLTPSEISAFNKWEGEVRLNIAKRKEMIQRMKEQNSQMNALFCTLWDRLSSSLG